MSEYVPAHDPEEPFSSEPCARCGSVPARVGTYMHVMSFLIFTRWRKYDELLCRECSTSNALKEQGKSLLLGWWGFPWGVLVFGATFYNTRTLLRWSNLGAPAALLIGLLSAVGLPGLVAFGLYQTGSGQRQAEGTGDWVSDETIEHYDRGHELLAAGQPYEALDPFHEALRRAPSSAQVNLGVAQAYFDLGHFKIAGRFTRKASELGPELVAPAALHGILLSKLDHDELAAERMEYVDTLSIEDGFDAEWAVTLAEEIGDRESQLAHAEAGLQLVPGDPYFRFHRLDALGNLGRLDEMEAALQELTEEEAAGASYFVSLLAMLRDPLGHLPALFETWDYQSAEAMEDFVAAAAAHGSLEAARSRVLEFLRDPDTSGDAWGPARPWFDETVWVTELDACLARRAEVLPALLRISELGPEETRRVLELTEPLRDSDHPAAQYIDMARFKAIYGRFGLGRLQDELTAHVAEHPDHVLCRLVMAQYLVDQAPALALQQVETLEPMSAEDPGLATRLGFLRAELKLAEWDASGALAVALRYNPYATEPYAAASHMESIVVESAFHSMNDKVYRQRLDRLLDYPGQGENAPGLLIKWADMLGRRKIPDWDKDVRGWLGEYADTAAKTQSASAIAILLAEGEVARDWAERVLTDDRQPTLDFVAAVKSSVAAGQPDVDALHAVVERSDGKGFAGRLAKRVIARLEAGPG